MRRVPLQWPGGARIAVLPQLVFELWSGDTVESGRSQIPGLTEEDVRLGRPDLLGRSWQAYGGKVGVGRILDLIQHHGVPASGFFNALAVERHPDFARAWVAAGHEIVAHSYAQDNRVFRMAAAEERENLRRCVDGIESVTGQRPVGWVSPGGQRSENTAALLLDHGFLYSCDYKDDDVPYIAEVINGRRLVALPKPYDINDWTIYARGHNPPSAYVEFFCRAFDILYEEGSASPKMINVTVHAPLYGRPMGASAFEECLRYAQEFSGVWFATGRQVVEWWLGWYDSQVPLG
ncbi:MAG: polysaccharide deacetylase family protein [Armatimonadetes bacterium]|nr:polysaccharide deacetylase family protein [Armatimonadota bacterium]